MENDNSSSHQKTPAGFTLPAILVVVAALQAVVEFAAPEAVVVRPAVEEVLAVLALQGVPAGVAV